MDPYSLHCCCCRSCQKELAVKMEKDKVDRVTGIVDYPVDWPVKLKKEELGLGRSHAVENMRALHEQEVNQLKREIERLNKIVDEKETMLSYYQQKNSPRKPSPPIMMSIPEPICRHKDYLKHCAKCNNWNL